MVDQLRVFRDVEDTGPSFIPHWGFDDAGNYGNDNLFAVHDEASPSVQPSLEEVQPPVEEEVQSSQCDDVTTLCDCFLLICLKMLINLCILDVRLLPSCF